MSDDEIYNIEADDQGFSDDDETMNTEDNIEYQDEEAFGLLGFNHQQPSQPRKKVAGTQFLSQSEREQILLSRALQIAMGAPVLVELDGELDPIKIARQEVREQKIPIIIRRFSVIEIQDPAVKSIGRKNDRSNGVPKKIMKHEGTQLTDVNLSFVDTSAALLRSDQSKASTSASSVEDMTRSVVNHPIFKKAVAEAVKRELGGVPQPPPVSTVSVRALKRRCNRQVTQVDRGIMVLKDGESISLQEMDFADFIHAVKANQANLDIPPELNIDLIKEQFGGQLLEAFKNNHSKFGFLVTQIITEPEVFKIAYLPALSNTIKTVKPRIGEKRQLNDKFISCFLFLVKYFGCSVVEDVHQYTVLSYIRETFNDRVNHVKNRLPIFMKYSDNSDKPFNLDNSFI